MAVADFPPPSPFFTLRPRAGEVTSLQYTSFTHKESVLIGTASGVVSLWDLNTKREFWHQSCENGIITTRPLSYSNPEEIISLGRQGHVIVWDIENEKVKNVFNTPDPGFCNFILLQQQNGSTSNTLMALADREYGQVNVYDTASGRQVLILKAKQPETKGMIMCLCQREEGKSEIMCGCEDGSVMLMDLRVTESETNSLKTFSEPVMCINYDSIRNHGLCGSPLNTLETFNISEQDCLQHKYSVPLKNNGVGCVNIRHDGRIMASGGWDGRIRVFGCKKGKPLAVLDFHTSTVHCISFSSTNSSQHFNNLMMCGSKDERISMWKLY